jgi:hypothetical protein
MIYHFQFVLPTPEGLLIRRAIAAVLAGLIFCEVGWRAEFRRLTGGSRGVLYFVALGLFIGCTAMLVLSGFRWTWGWRL